MIDDILIGLMGEAVRSRLSGGPRAQLLARLFFGLLGAGLGLAGAVYMLQNPRTKNVAMATSMVTVFAGLSCFCLFNVALARPWRWPGWLFIVSFIAMFASRLMFGA